MPQNVLVIVADDLGWRDLGCYGSSFYETPNLDRLAQHGTRFTDAYAAAPVCSPTRASAMTGQYPARVGVTDWIDFNGGTHPAKGKLVDAEYVDHLPTAVTTLPEALSEAGYDTWHVGKWHLGGEGDHSLPEDHGFDVNVAGCEWGMPLNGYFSPYGMPNLDDGPDGEYLTDRLTDEAIRLLTSRDGDDPFFLNVSYYAVHTPIQAKSETVAKYERKRAALDLDDRQEFEVGERFPTEHKRDGRIKRRLVQSDPEYAAMVQHLDENVGRLLDAFERERIADDTLVVFTSDNGGLATAEGSPTCNRPLSQGKGWMEEGGNRVPFLVRWPGVTDNCTDELLREPVVTPDVYSTVLDAAGVEMPVDQAVDGESLRPLFTGSDLEREAVFWHYPHYGNQGGTPAGAVRVGDWKLIEFYEDDHVELYDISSDVAESRDLSGYLPERTADMRERLSEWCDAVNARLPEDNPDFEPWDGWRGPGN